MVKSPMESDSSPMLTKEDLEMGLATAIRATSIIAGRLYRRHGLHPQLLTTQVVRGLFPPPKGVTDMPNYL